MIASAYTYRLEQIAGLRSVHAIRLFEFLMQYKRTGRFVVKVEDFKAWLELEDQYARFSNLKARVIEPAVRELREKSRLAVEWKPLKKGRTVERLEFTFRLEGTLFSGENAESTPVPAAIEPKSKPGKAGPPLSREYIEQHALPGESWETARLRLSQQRSKSA